MRRVLTIAALAWLMVPAGSAAAGTSTLTLSGGVLRWDAVGDASNSSFHAASRPDICNGVRTPCTQMSSQGAPFASTPGAPCAGASCPQDVVTTIELAGDGSGPFQITTTPGARSPDYVCETPPLTIIQKGSDGGTATNDGCAQTIRCAIAYEGRVDADGSDVVEDSCRWLVRDNVLVRRDPLPSPSPSPQPTPAPGPTPSPTPTPGAPSGPAPAGSPLARVDVQAKPGRRLSIAVRVKRPTRFTVLVERRGGGRWVRSATKSLVARAAGTVRTTIGVAGPRRARAGRYRVIVSTKGSKVRLISSSLRVR
ncbi:MAG: hypothetical protein ACEQSX_16585 [Baekduiaceae bacterium]